MGHIFEAQLTSLIAEGAFERFPELRVVLLESGFGWLPPLLWRLDKEWKGLRREIPWVKHAPVGDDPRARPRGRAADRRAARRRGARAACSSGSAATSCSSTRATTRTPTPRTYEEALGAGRARRSSTGGSATTTRRRSIGL